MFTIVATTRVKRICVLEPYPWFVTRAASSARLLMSSFV